MARVYVGGGRYIFIPMLAHFFKNPCCGAAEQPQDLAKKDWIIHDMVSEGPNGRLWVCIHYIYIYTTLQCEDVPGQSLHGTTVPELA